MNWCAAKFLTEAKTAHRRGMELRKQGLTQRAYVAFVERDHLMKLAKGYR